MVLALWNVQRELKEQVKKEKPQISVFKGVFRNKCKNCLLAKMAWGPASNLKPQSETCAALSEAQGYLNWAD
jgi:hypothetical protein